ncbi:DUF4249 family protein [Zobellia galactanivorans]|uniref:Putative membrane lipoprotein n=1 Tax=Zobellia galactanivorans (strain DSM 12802 / CCUG 47099 / CIP 106680 / NCIMB 13871 / Dsij) TaxID=63186 RepID=G0LCV8_ZOBGA|nr:DUF4249 family protein [Zobellia galactanivorans]MBU3027115.1 DUF4249 domain-containing protein [Zobellia galactanivorans]CAZ94090.1 Putative membrane lipoprotein [Zobellia galactanivorans]
MKKLIYILCMLPFFTACEDVVEIDVPTDKPRLSVDALMRINTTEASTSYTAEVRVSASSNFFESIEPVELDLISLTNVETRETINLFNTYNGSGIYQGDTTIDFMTSGELILYMEYQGEQYAARTTYVPTVPIDKLVQGDATLFSGDETEIIVAFKDQPDRTDFYLFDFDFNEYLVTEDTFYPGRTFEFSYFYDDNVTDGMNIEVSIMGVDQSFYNYMNQLIVQSGGDQGPFQTPSATVRGNIVNVTGIEDLSELDDLASIVDQDNFALGYFAVCQTFTNTIAVE